ncbi:unnamed protein product [Soboliphyme baturini]|uniref:Uncharacterized protein n=1 Tax=Soboliphyme baturini TaxID=241478 RepID=A0A183IA96_9BILA|nr:unnamed protein product [Soboliphyme baturini]
MTMICMTWSELINTSKHCFYSRKTEVLSC